jgi:predicted transcriptional regulator
VAATSLKLPDELKARVERIAAHSQQTPHAFMLDAVQDAVRRAESREQFAADAAESEEQALRSGKAISLDAAFDYLGARIAGKEPRRPRSRAWRKLK